MNKDELVQLPSAAALGHHPPGPPSPLNVPRMETGPVQFGEDWPGVFIRGDNAMGFAMALDSLLKYNDPISRMVCTGYLQVLHGCRVNREDCPLPPNPHSEITTHS